MENKKLTPEIDACKKSYMAGHKVSDEDIANASMSVLEEYRHQSYPTPPKSVAEYFAMKPDLKLKMNRSPENYQGFWNDQEVKGYFDQRCKIKNLNERNKAWLEWMKKILPDQELPIRMKLHQFEDVAPGMEQPNWSD